MSTLCAQSSCGSSSVERESIEPERLRDHGESLPSGPLSAGIDADAYACGVAVGGLVSDSIFMPSRMGECEMDISNFGGVLGCGAVTIVCGVAGLGKEDDREPDGAVTYGEEGFEEARGDAERLEKRRCKEGRFSLTPCPPGDDGAEPFSDLLGEGGSPPIGGNWNMGLVTIPRGVGGSSAEIG
jgi:hypothetical protein